MAALKFNTAGNLEPGIHPMDWTAFVDVFGRSAARARLLSGIERAARSLRAAGCPTLYVDGSFVTRKEAIAGTSPNDFDACWDLTNVDPTQLDPVLLDFKNRRAAQKAKFFGELFPIQFPADTNGTPFLDFFQLDKASGDPKGIIAVDLSSLP